VRQELDRDQKYYNIVRLAQQKLDGVEREGIVQHPEPRDTEKVSHAGVSMLSEAGES
jgi:hypothetical protein